MPHDQNERENPLTRKHSSPSTPRQKFSMLLLCTASVRSLTTAMYFPQGVQLAQQILPRARRSAMIRACDFGDLFEEEDALERYKALGMIDSFGRPRLGSLQDLEGDWAEAAEDARVSDEIDDEMSTEAALVRGLCVLQIHPAAGDAHALAADDAHASDLRCYWQALSKKKLDELLARVDAQQDGAEENKRQENDGED